jgi:deoxyribodipyrimidine photo-lyase
MTALVASRAEGRARLAAFLPHAGRTYASERNYDHGPADRSNVSMLSPYVRRRLVSEPEVIAAVLERFTLSSAEKFVQEVVWRTYWKGWLESRPAVWADYGAERDDALARRARDADLDRRIRAAEAGTTGIAGLDDWARELVATGYLHNHARMWFASIWIFTLGLPWTSGADFFLRYLLDGDAASNTLSWRWVAGLHTVGKTYLATRDNIVRYTGGRIDPGTVLARRADALSGPAYAPGPLPVVDDAGSFAGRGVLLVHDDECGFATLGIAPERIAAVAGLTCETGRSPEPVSDDVRQFARGALADALSEAAAAGIAPAGIVEASGAPAVADALERIVRDAGVATLIVPFIPVGPVRDVFAAVRPLLEARGIAVAVVGRRWDAAAWPYATRGFFNLKRVIPKLVTPLAG